MKKLLEVLQYGESDIRFNTDLDPDKLQKVIPDLSSTILFSMLTKLWGGNETAVLAVIRCLAIADLAASVNRKEMIGFLDSASENLVSAFEEAKRAFEQKGMRIKTFGPLVTPPKKKS